MSDWVNKEDLLNFYLRTHVYIYKDIYKLVSVNVIKCVFNWDIGNNTYHSN